MVRVRGRLVNEELWAARVVWATLPLTVGPALGDAIHGWDVTVRGTATIGLWAGWLVAMIATLVPHPIALTTFRVAGPVPIALAAAAAIGGHASVLGAVAGVLVVALAFLPAIAAWCVNGPAYANERRYPLRPPAVVLFGPAAVAWFVTLVGPSAAVLLLAERRWVFGVVVAVIGCGGSVLTARALHGLSRRWFVFVPAGIVLHDPLTMADPVLFQRPVVDGLGPAPAEADGHRLDMTAGAAGLALTLRLREPTGVMAITKPGRRPTAETVEATEILVAPSRASAVLADAQDRGYLIS